MQEAANAQRELQAERCLLAEANQRVEKACADALQARHAEAMAKAHLATILNSTTWRAMSGLHTMFAHKPRLRRIIRRSAKLIWWTATFQLLPRIAERRLMARDVLPLSSSAEESSAKRFPRTRR
jgi:hypothetical protein